VNIQVKAFYVVTLYGVAVGYQPFGRFCYLYFQGSKILRNVGILPQHCTASQINQKTMTYKLYLFPTLTGYSKV